MPEFTTLVVIDSLAPGGAEVSLAATASYLIESGVDLHVAYFHEQQGVGPRLREAGASLCPLTSARLRIARVNAVRRLVGDLRPNLVHTTLFEADICGRPAARLAGVPVVSSLVNDMYGEAHFAEHPGRSLKVRAGWLLDVSTAQLVRRFHAISETVADVMARRLRVRRDSIDVVPRGRDPRGLENQSPERRKRLRAELGIAESSPVLLAVGRQEPQKRHDVLIEAVGLLRATRPDLVLLIAGKPGNASDALRSLVSQGGLESQVKFLGHRDDVPALLGAADAFVMASGREGQSGALIEAMGSRTPIVASDLAVFREVTQTGDGPGAVLVGATDAIGFAASVEAVLNAEPQDVRLMTDRAFRRFTERYTLEASARGMLDFYRRALES